VISEAKGVPLKKRRVVCRFRTRGRGPHRFKGNGQAINKELLNQYCAMINIDSLGLGIPQADTNISSKKLIERAQELSKRMQTPFEQGAIVETSTDSSSFLARKIPAISIHGLSNAWRQVLHTNNDRVSKVNPMSVFLGYKLALAIFGEVEDSPCDAFR
jgi:hypothetical protein